MNYAQIITHDVANGPGFRVSLFVSGCSRHCAGCFNEVAWDKDFGEEFGAEAERKLLGELWKPYYHGLTVLGGEPFEPYNRQGVLDLVSRVRSELPNRNVWIYTGFLYEELIKDEISEKILSMADVLVDGPFVLEKRDLMLRFRGSENQRIIDLKKSNKGNVVLSDYMRDRLVQDRLVRDGGPGIGGPYGK